ncbi:MAG: hypothetical protein ACREO4_02330 [Lysobacter sp.]
MTGKRNTDTNPEPPKPKRIYLKVILKVVLKGASIAWWLYRMWSRLTEILG